MIKKLNKIYKYNYIFNYIYNHNNEYNKTKLDKFIT